MIVSDITSIIEQKFPLSLQESYDNSGLQIGNNLNTISGVLICLDISEEIINEAIEQKLNLIIAHHPLIFSPIKSLRGNTYIEKCIIKAIKNDINIYACHTNADNSVEGVNNYIAKKIGLKNIKCLNTGISKLKKLITFVPESEAENVRNAICNAGSGKIGNYDKCTFNSKGQGTFRALDGSKPYVGEKNKIHFENEIKIESIFPDYLQNNIVFALINSHPYEEPAYDILSLENSNPLFGGGIIGFLPDAISEIEFLESLKSIFNAQSINYSKLLEKKIRTVAICGGAGSFLLNSAISARADVFITGETRYHQFFDAQNKILYVGLGHFESEQYTINLFFDLILKKYPKFAVRISEKISNPVNYLI